MKITDKTKDAHSMNGLYSEGGYSRIYMGETETEAYLIRLLPDTGLNYERKAGTTLMEVVSTDKDGRSVENRFNYMAIIDDLSYDWCVEINTVDEQSIIDILKQQIQ